MSELLLQWFEIIFNVTYLAVIWTLVVKMFCRKDRVSTEKYREAIYLLGAFFLLALGDTGHVGFRVLAYAQGGLKNNGLLVGMGALATAITVTLFYILILETWREHFQKPRGLVWIILLAAAVVRLILMSFPQNQWASIVPPFEWSLLRNIPLMIQGLGIAGLILYDATRNKDRTFTWVGVMILLSYACYLPVILWVQKLPIIGMLMIPKTLAYIAIAFIVYGAYYKKIKPINK